MHYKIRKDKKDELQEGRTIQYISNMCKYSRQYVSYVLNGNVAATEECAINIIKGVAQNSINIAIRLNQNGVKNTLDYFFEGIED